MPIYEFYCSGCHVIFSFFSKSVNTSKRPLCPKCKHKRLERQVSSFSMGGSGNDGSADDLPIDERTMERAVTALAGEAEKIDGDDPRQAAGLMRKFSSMTGMKFGDGIDQAIGRMEAGEDPEKIESDMGDVIDAEEPFVSAGRKGSSTMSSQRSDPARDDNLYEM